MLQEYLLESDQFFRMQGWRIGIGIVLSQQVIFVLSELVEWQQLDAGSTNVFQPLREAGCIAERIIVARNHWNTGQDIFAMGNGQTHIGQWQLVGYTGAFLMTLGLPVLHIEKKYGR